MSQVIAQNDIDSKNAGYVVGEDESAQMTEKDLAEDAQWKLIQKNTFTRWTNEHLKKNNMFVEDLETDLSDGLRLLALIEVLTSHKFRGVHKKPVIRTQKFENVTLALKYLEEDEGLRLVNIDSSHIVDHNLKLILGLIWSLIMHYSISLPTWEGDSTSTQDKKAIKEAKRSTTDGDLSPKQRLLQWIKNKIPEYPIKNFTTDWNNGKAIGALVDACAPGLCPDWKDWDHKQSLKNASDAMNLADMWLDIPQLVKPDELVNPNVDEKAMMTYLSQFPSAKLKEGAPLRPRINPSRVRAYGPGLEPTGNTLGMTCPFIVDALGCGQANLDVIVLNPKGFREPCEVKRNAENDQSYDCEYEPRMEGEYRIIIKYAGAEISKSPFHVQIALIKTDPSKVVASGPGIDPKADNYVGRNTYFNVFTSGAGRGDVDCVIVDGQGRRDTVLPRITCPNTDGVYLVEYTPKMAGPHQVAVLFNGSEILGSPFSIDIQPRGRQNNTNKEGIPVHVTPITTAKPQPVRVERQPIKPLPYSDEKQPDAMVSLYPNIVGKTPPKPSDSGRVKVESPTTPTDSAPVTSRSKFAYVTGRGVQPHGIRVQDKVSFRVHTERTGEPNGRTDVSIVRSDGVGEDSRVEKLSPDLWECTYSPQRPGKYAIKVLYNDNDVQGSPFDVVIGPYKQASVTAFGPGLHTGVVNCPNVFTVVCNDGNKKIGFSIGGPSQARMDCCNNKDGSARITYWVSQPGEYAVHILCDDEDIPNSPYMPIIHPDSGAFRPDRVRVYGPGVERLNPNLGVNKPTEFIVEGLAEAVPTSVYRGLTDANLNSVLNLECYDPNGQPLPLQVKRQPDGGVVCGYTPKRPGAHTIYVSVGDMPVKGAPFRVHVSDARPDRVKIFGPGLEEAGVNKVTHFFVDPRDAFPGEDDYPSALELNPVSVNLVDQLGRAVHHQVFAQPDGTHRVEYIPSSSASEVYITPKLGPLSTVKSPVVVAVKPDVDVRGVRVLDLEPRVFKASYVKFAVDASAIDKTGKGKLLAVLNAPNNVRLVCQVNNNQDGTYACSYTPLEEGPHMIDITYEGAPVPGSPFPVRVMSGCDPSRVKAYGPGLEDGPHLMPNKTAEFTVDLTGAGQGSLGLAVEGPSEAPIECKDNRDGTCTVTYTPKDPGNYAIFIRFNDVNVAKSPYNVNVKPKVDPSLVQCYGPGLESGLLRCGWPTYFTVDTKRAGDAPLKVMYSPRPGAPLVPASIQPLGTLSSPTSELLSQSQQPYPYHKVTYTPETDGPCRVEVTYAGQHVPGSPFNIQIRKQCEPERVRVFGNGVEGPVLSSLPATFTVDARDAGMGDLTLGLLDPNGQSIPVRVMPMSTDNESVLANGGVPSVASLASGDVSDSGLLRCIYQPYIVGPHSIKVMFGNEEVDNSPFVVQCIPTGRADLCGIKGDVAQVIPIGEEYAIRVDTQLAGKGQLTCQVVQKPSEETGDAGILLLPTETEDNGDGTISVYYTPTQLGELAVELRFGGQLIPNGEFVQKVVTPEQLDGGKFVDATPTNSFRQVQFRFPVPKQDVEIECMVIRPSGMQQPVAHELDMKEQTLTVIYYPEESGMHELHVNTISRIKGESSSNRESTVAMPMQGSPYRFYVDQIGTGKVAVYGPGLSHGVTNQPAEFVIVTREAGGGGLALSVEGPSKAEITCDENKDGTCNVSYLPLTPGEYKISIKYQNEHVSGSPFVAKIAGDMMERALLNMVGPNDFALDAHGDDIATLTASVSLPCGREEPCVLKRLHNNRLGISFTPKEIGEHVISVFQAGQHIANSPFRIRISEKDIGDCRRVRVSGPGLISGIANQPNQFTVDTQDAGYAGLSLSIEGPSKAEIECHDNHDGTCSVIYTPTEPGAYVINVKYSDEHVPNSPFHVNIDGNRSTQMVEQITRQREASSVTSVGSRCELSLRVFDTRLEDMSALVTSPSDVTSACEIVPVGSDHYNIKFVPQEMGEHYVTVKKKGINIAGSPFLFTVGPITDGVASKVRALGPGLQQGLTEELNEFIVYTREAGAGTLAIAIEGPSKAEINCVEQPGGPSIVSYSVGQPGIYMCSLKFDDQHIPFSPFRIYINDRNAPGGVASYILPTASADQSAAPPSSATASAVDSSHPLSNSPVTFTVHHEATENHQLCAIVHTPSGRVRSAVVHSIDQDQYTVRFVPLESGPHLVHVHSVPNELVDRADLVLGTGSPFRPIRGSPFRLVVSHQAADPELVHAIGDGLLRGAVDEVNTFFVNTDKAGTGVLNVAIDGPTKVMLTTEERKGGYAFSYVPLLPGTYDISIKYGGNYHIAGSPFKVEVTAKKAPHGTPVRVEEVRSQPDRAGIHVDEGQTARLTTKLEERVVTHEQLHQAYKVTCDGVGLRRAALDRLNYFNVDASRIDVPHGSEILLVGARGPTRPCDEVKVTHLGSNVYSVAYRVHEKGRHMLMVKWGDDHIPGSPFVVDVP